MLRIGVLASHEGTTLQSIIDACAQERISGRVVAVISNNSASGALRRAAAAGIETVHLSSLTHSGGDSLDAAICGVLERARADVVFLAGYMKRLGPRTLRGPALGPARVPRPLALLATGQTTDPNVANRWRSAVRASEAPRASSLSMSRRIRSIPC